MRKRTTPKPTHHLLVEQANWSAVLQARKEGVSWGNLRTRTGLSALGMAIFEGSALATQMLLEMSAPVMPEKTFDGKMFSPLWAALERHKPAIVDLVLQAGADPNEFHPDLGTPLEYAAREKLLEETLVLCRHGSIPNTEQPPSPLWVWIKHTVPVYDHQNQEWTFPEHHPIVALLKNGARVHLNDEGVGLNEIELAKKLWLRHTLHGKHQQNVAMTLSLMEKNLYTHTVAEHMLQSQDEDGPREIKKKEHRM